MKPYKAYPPSITINKIRTLLEQIGVFLREDSYCSNNCLFTTRVSMSCGRMEQLNIGTNGKGTTYQYALASGYAEFMERLQNNLLFKGYKNATKRNLQLLGDNYYKKTLIEKDLSLDFLYDPHEIKVSVENEVNQHFDFLKALFPFFIDRADAIDFFKNKLNFKQLICVPYYSHKTKGEVFLPIEIIEVACGSNGMASGNTKEEALIQGFCEILERYSGYEIYRKNLTPANIPLSEFKDYPAYEMVSKLIEENEYTLIIKDCSLGLGIPTLGVLTIDENNYKYNFNLGTALDPGVALERCLTELYQCAEGLTWYDMKFEQYTGNPEYTEDFIFINGNKLFLDSSGYWPLSLFAQKPSYDYKGLNKNLNDSDTSDLSFIKNLINRLGFEIFVRDVSFMGFNAYYIVVPGMSQYPSKREHYHILGDTYECLHAVRNIKKITKEKLQEICKLINADYKNLKLYNFDFNELIVYHVDKDLRELDLELLFFMLNYKAGNLKQAYSFMLEFLRDKDFCAYKYYYGIKDYLKLRMNNFSDEDIINTLGILYKDEISEIIEDVKNPENIMEYYNWPSCFECEDCCIKKDCCQFEFLRIMKNIQEKQKAANISHKQFIL